MPEEYVDDAELPDDAVLWRAINPRNVKPDGTVSSAAYKTEGLSVYVLAETTSEALRAKFPGWGFQWFPAKHARDAGCIIVKITDDAGDTSHREVCRADDPKAQLRRHGVEIMNAAQWIADNIAGV
jgi:hypothetical protein